MATNKDEIVIVLREPLFQEDWEKFAAAYRKYPSTSSLEQNGAVARAAQECEILKEPSGIDIGKSDPKLVAKISKAVDNAYSEATTISPN